MKHYQFRIISRIIKDYGAIESIRMFWRMSYNIRKSMFGKAKVLDTLYIQITSKCNLHCVGCYTELQDCSNANVFLYNIDDSLFDFICSIRNIVVLGGEPFLPECKPFLLRLINTHKGSISIVTNATMIDADIINAIRHARNTKLMISLDGLEQLHDARRGNGCFKLVCENCLNLRNRKIMFGISGTITKENMHELLSEEFIEKAISIGAYFALFLPYLPVGSIEDKEYALSEEEYYQSYERIVNLNSKFKRFACYHAVMHETMTSYGGCRAGTRCVYIKANGYVTPCPVIDANRLYWTEFLKHFSEENNPYGCLVRLKSKYPHQCMFYAARDEVNEILDKNGLLY